jgi:hypothetical protein
MADIPPYDPSQEQRKQPKTGELDVQGIWVGTGETRKLINPEIVWVMAEVGCPDSEIAEWLGITESTFKFNFSGYASKARLQLKQKLRRAQIKTALSGQPTMLVWLGKNILGQSETPLGNPELQPLPWNNSQPSEPDTDAIN